MKRPKSNRDLGSAGAHEGSGGFVRREGGSTGNLEEKIIDKLQQLKLPQEDDCCGAQFFSTSSKWASSTGATCIGASVPSALEARRPTQAASR